MSANSPPPSAKIYQFPTKTSVRGDRFGRDVRPAAERRPPAYVAVEFGSGWYHEAAMQAEPGRKS